MKTLKSMLAGIALLFICVAANAITKPTAGKPTKDDVVKIYIDAITSGNVSNLNYALADDLQFDIQRGQNVNTLNSANQLDFHSNFWINLHHYLFQQAQPSQLSTNSLDINDSKIWNDAIEYYRKNILPHDLLFDHEMITIDSVLAENESSPKLSSKLIDVNLVKVLNDVAPIYRKQWWNIHNRTNRLWISTAEPLFLAFGVQLHEQLAVAYGTPWYSGAIRVDVCVYAGPRLVAYTNGEEHGHVITSSTNSRGQGLDVLEIIFHEAAHTIVHEDKGLIGQTIKSASKAHGILVPDGLWHALMFYTTGELTRRNLAQYGLTYIPYADKNDLWKGSWSNYYGVLSIFWRQHLDGKLTIEEAINKMIDAIAVDFSGTATK
ncbi:MAG TPA: hypothetical protein VFE53_01455 [Mucilaginibacter sp.]|jgi:hypothetical protein|nr:hypothetical protein [Mucilaginibacter sp.]